MQLYQGKDGGFLSVRKNNHYYNNDNELKLVTIPHIFWNIIC
jgi:hypothetical protein